MCLYAPFYVTEKEAALNSWNLSSVIDTEEFWRDATSLTEVSGLFRLEA